MATQHPSKHGVHHHGAPMMQTWKYSAEPKSSFTQESALFKGFYFLPPSLKDLFALFFHSGLT
jgi:hypothetical protein